MEAVSHLTSTCMMDSAGQVKQITSEEIMLNNMLLKSQDCIQQKPFLSLGIAVIVG